MPKAKPGAVCMQIVPIQELIDTTKKKWGEAPQEQTCGKHFQGTVNNTHIFF